jgi:hypothetical protein
MNNSAYPIDTYRDSFLRFMADGMSYSEALEQFDQDEFANAAFVEMYSREARIDLLTHEFVTNDSRKLPALFQLLTRAQFEKRNSVDGRDYQQALELWQAGWTSESKTNPPKPGFWHQAQVMSWYWRRPPRRPGKPGRRYLSTNQAWTALQREEEAKREPNCGREV